MRMSSALASAAVFIAVLAAPIGAAPPLVADLSRHLVAITTGFAGTEVLLFGAVEEKGDVVVVLRGPQESVVMYRKSNIAGIWMNTASMTIDGAPSFYAVASSRPLEEITSAAVRRRHQLGTENLQLHLPAAKASPNVRRAWREALIRNKQRLGLYREQVGRVSFVGERLFRTEIPLPSNVSTGIYLAETYFLSGGEVVSAQSTPLVVSKVGAEADIFEFAHQKSALYGLIAVVIALVSGWLAHLAFRRG